jgi:hypothetical protein
MYVRWKFIGNSWKLLETPSTGGQTLHYTQINYVTPCANSVTYKSVCVSGGYPLYK